MIWVLILSVVALAVYCAFTAFKYTRMISNIFLGLVYRPTPDVVTDVRGERLTILDSSDREIQALYLECKNSDRVMIFCHESGSTKESWEKYAYFFPAMGYHVLSVDLGEQAEDSEHNPLIQWPCGKEVEQLLTVIRWTKHALSSRPRVVLFGISNGADLALAASFRDSSVEAVITDGLFSMKEIFRARIRRWAPILVRPNLFGENYPDWVVNIFAELGFWHCQRRSRQRFVDVEKLLRKKHAPLLMIHGDQDELVTQNHQRLLETLEGKKSFARYTVKNARHNEAIALSPGGYADQIRHFLERALR